MATLNNSRAGVSIAGDSVAANNITNNGSNAILTGGASADSIYNYAYNVSIDAGADADYVYNSGRYATIDSGAGDDKIYNSYSGDYSKINGGDGNDSIVSNDEDYSTIDGGSGDDTIEGHYWSSSISGGADNDRISLGAGGYNNTINGGTGNDTIYGDTINFTPALIQYSEGDGNDVLYGFRSNSTLKINGTVSSISASGDDTGADIYLSVGQDTITLKNAVSARMINVITDDGNISASLQPYAGRFTLHPVSNPEGNNNVSFSTVTETKVVTEGGDDTVTTYSNSSHDNYFDTGDGNDYIGNNGYSTTIDSGAGNDQIYCCSNTRYDSIEAGEGNDYVQSGGHHTTINGDAGNDTIYSYGQYSTVYGGADNDYIQNQGANAKIDGGEGDDYVYNYNYVTGTSISGGAGNDTVVTGIGSDSVSIDGGTGNNYIQLGGNNSTVRVADGDDSIMLSSSVSTLKVEGFNYGDRIVLAQEVDSINTFGNNVTAGSVTIGGIGGESTATSWMLDDNVASYVETTRNTAVLLNDRRTIVYGQGRESKSEVLATVSGVTSTDGLDIDVEHKVVTVSISSLSQDLTVEVSDDYMLALGEDVPEPELSEGKGWRFDDNENIATYKTDSTTDGYVLDRNRISYQSIGEAETLVEVKGVTSTEGLSIDTENKTVTVSESSLSKDSEVTISEGYELKLADGITTETTENAGWVFEGDTASYVDGSIERGYVLEDNKIYYKTEGMENTLVTVTGVKSVEEALHINTTDKIVTIDEAALSEDSTVSISEGYTLALGDVTKMTLKDVTWDYAGTTAEGRIEVGTSGYKLENNTITYVKEGMSTSVFVYNVNEVTSGIGITVDPITNVVTLSREAVTGRGGNGRPIRVSSGYTLALDDTVDVPSFEEPSDGFDEGTNEYSYSGGTRQSGWELVNNEVVYRSYFAGITEPVIIKGVSSKEGVQRDPENRKNFIISSSSLDKSILEDEGSVRFGPDTDGYTMSLGDDVDRPTRVVSKGWQLEDSTATYHTGSTTDGYVIGDGDDSIKYVAPEVDETVAAVTGVKSVEGLLLTQNANESVVTVYRSSLDKKNVSIAGGYKLELLDEGLNPQNQTGWKLSDKRATYEVGGWTEGYRYLESDNIIEYSPEASGVVKIALAGVDKKPNFVDGYEGDAEDNEDGKAGAVSLTPDNFTEEGISVESNERGYSFEIAKEDYGNTKFVGKETEEVITNHGGEIAFELGAGKDTIVTDGANVSVDAGEGNDSINNSGGIGSTIKGGKGNDNVTLSSSDTAENIFFYANGDGKDKVSGFGKRDKLQIDTNAAISAEVKNDDVIFKVGNGTITLRDIAKEKTDDSDYHEIVIVDSEGDAISTISGSTYTHDGVIRDVETEISVERQIVLASTFEGKYTASNSEKKTGNVTIVDASRVTKNVSLDGGEEGLSLIGGSGKDTLISGTTDGFELTGGKGNDVFFYNGKKGRIKDYSQKGTDGKDKLELASEFNLDNLKDFTYSSDELTLNFGDGNELTLEGIKSDTEITFGAKSSTIRTFKAEGMFDEKGKSVVLSANKDYFKAQGNFSKLEEIDGSKTTSGSTIIGNKKANYIIASADGSTLDGSKGKDTLVGGDGQDVFVYDSKNGAGNKLIVGYDSGDKISITGGKAVLSEVKLTGSDKKDLELTVGSNKITIEGGAGKSFDYSEQYIENTELKTRSQTFTTDGLLVDGQSASLTSAFVGTEVDMSKYNYTSVDASLVKRAFNLVGDSETNSIIGGKGKDTLTAGSSGSNLWGGKGNDLLIGCDDASDKFIFRAGEGTDTIQGFESLDELWIYDKRGNESTYNKAVFGDDTLTLSIKDGGKVILTGIDANDSIKINGYAHTISGKKLN